MLEGIHTNLTPSEFETILLQKIAEKIEEYIFLINPTNTVYIAFDGFAPEAKLKQQIVRRYKNSYFSTIKFGDENDKVSKFNKNEITPGTEFMKRLSKYMEDRFLYSEKRYNVKRVIISTPNEDGEGEHKLYEYMRGNVDTSEDVAIYGLDADLIMLSIIHMKCVKNIYIFREAPAFMNSSIPVDNKNDVHFLDVLALTECILHKMNCKFHNSGRIIDYVFMCFFLGNDFLPHLPSLNIRTHGIDIILDIYRMHIGDYKNRNFVSLDNDKIVWKNVKRFIHELAKKEHDFLLIEHKGRSKFDTHVYPEKTPKEKEAVFQNIPVIYRAEEKYICPSEPFWEDRYYKVLFFDWKKKENPEKEKIEICKNYIDGLCWVFNYYFGKKRFTPLHNQNAPKGAGFECQMGEQKDWFHQSFRELDDRPTERGLSSRQPLRNLDAQWCKWYYKYKYGPLLKDIYMNMPILDEDRDFDYSSDIKRSITISNFEPMALSWSYSRYMWESK